MHHIRIDHFLVYLFFLHFTLLSLNNMFDPVYSMDSQALQYVQENPDEVCPAGWKPGEKSMKPDPKLSKEYFSAV